jgi:uncharacterized membrane protein
MRMLIWKTISGKIQTLRKEESKMFELHMWHPKMVNFAVALIPVALICEIIWLVTKKEIFREVARWNIIFGAVAAILSLATGLIAEESITHTRAAHDILDLHETVGYITLVISVLLLAWRLLKSGQWYRRFPKLFLVLLIAGTISISVGGYLGGKLVFDYGTGVNPSVKTATPDQQIDTEED